MSKLETSKANGPHAMLATLVGKWTGNCKTWFEKDVLADESPMTGEIAAVTDGRFFQYNYSSTLTGKPFEGILLMGYDLGNEKFQCSWVDTFHMGTGIMLSEGAASADGFTVLGSYGGPGIPEPWGWRTEFKLNGPDELTITAYNISPEGDAAKATEVVYKKMR